MEDARSGLVLRTAGYVLTSLWLCSVGIAGPIYNVPLGRSDPPPIRDSQPLQAATFKPIQQEGQGGCISFHPPRLISAGAIPRMPAVIDVVVGTDGHIEDFIILKSSGSTVAGRQIEESLRHRVYEPATCNGMPVEAQGRIEISRR